MSDRGHTFGAPVGSGLGSPPIQVMMQNPFNLSDLQFLPLSNGNNYVSCLFHGLL